MQENLVSFVDADTKPAQFMLAVKRCADFYTNPEDPPARLTCDGIVYRIFGLEDNSTESIFGWGGQSSYVLEGRYEVVRVGGPQTGSYWAALQAKRPE
jgi:hypothetical protein